MATKKTGKRPVLGTPVDAEMPQATVGQSALIATVMRAVQFLRGVMVYLFIRSVLQRFGYTLAVQREGWDLVMRATGMKDLPQDGKDPRAVEAILEIDGRDEDLFRVVRASVIHRHPAQAAFLLDGIGPGEGIESVLNMRHLLDRLDALESAPEREATRAEDHAALATLSSRAITKELRTELRTLVDTAQSPDGPAPSAEELARLAADRQKALIQLRVWYEEWSEIARVAIKRRSHLQALGLASRGGRKGAAEDEVEDDVAGDPPAPVAPAGNVPGADEPGV
jgi:hypothetical protein